MSIEETLLRARSLIDNKENWIQGGLAATEEGEIVSPHSPNACKFCMAGALERAGALSHPDEFHIYTYVLKAVLNKGYYFIAAFNDDPTTTHDDVIGLFDEAIEMSKTGRYQHAT